MPRALNFYLVALVALWLSSLAYAGNGARVEAKTIGKCKYSEESASLGGYRILRITFRGSQKTVARDMTGVAEDAEGGIVFSTSPTYGRPGLFRFDCQTGARLILVKPKTKSKSYPHGADYFELVSLSGNGARFYYAPDVDATDFNSFRTKENLFEVRLNGTGFRKSTGGQ